jgi:HlyD family secretion protein
MSGKSKSSPVKWIVILLLLCAAGGGAYWYTQKAGHTPIEYRTVEVTRGDVLQSVTATGQLTPVKNVQVGSQVSGIINELRVDFNSKVKEGDIIAQIDPATLKSNLQQSEADLANAKASMELAQVNYNRAMLLRKGDLIPQADADQALATLHQAQASVQMREATVDKSRVDLSHATIYAPISGVVISRAVDVGQTVAASFSTPTLFQIANDLAKMEIDAMVSEADVGGVTDGQQVNFTVDAFPNRQFEGKVRQVRFNPTTNQNVVTYTTVVDVDNKDLKLRPGMTANATILTAQKTDVVKLPNAALRFRPPDAARATKTTNTVGSAGMSRGATNTTGSGAAMAATVPDGAPTPPWVAEGRSPNGREEVQAWMQSLTPAQREQIQKARGARGGGGPGGGMGGGMGGSRAGRMDESAPRTVYVMENENGVPTPKPVTVKLGITDGAFTEVISGLAEGAMVITGTNQVGSATATRAGGASSPFGGPFGGGRPPR